MRKFDFYEFTAVLLPGVVLLFGFERMFPHIWGPAHDKEYTATEFGLFVLIAYAAGHIIQAIGNWLDPVVWGYIDNEGKPQWPWRLSTKVNRKWWQIFEFVEGETPINRFREAPELLLTTDQLVRFEAQFKNVLLLTWPKPPTVPQNKLCPNWPDEFRNHSKEQWTAIHRQIHAAVKQAKLAGRCDIFASNYAMVRGLLASFIAIAVAYLVIAPFCDEVEIHWWVWLILFLASWCAIVRMNRFGRYLARETYVQFLIIK